MKLTPYNTHTHTQIWYKNTLKTMEKRTQLTQKNDAAYNTAIAAYDDNIHSLAYDITSNLRQKHACTHTLNILWHTYVCIY
jgi:hypothetical protein